MIITPTLKLTEKMYIAIFNQIVSTLENSTFDELEDWKMRFDLVRYGNEPSKIYREKVEDLFEWYLLDYLELIPELFEINIDVEGEVNAFIEDYNDVLLIKIDEIKKERREDR